MTDFGPGQVLFAFVRHWSRKADPRVADRGQVVQVVEAVHALTGRSIGVTVNAIAQEIGIDQSGASRLVRSATEAGYLATSVSRQDARRKQVALTPVGVALLEDAHRWQEAIFAQLTEGWSGQRRQEFRDAMEDLMRRSWDMADSATS